MSSFFSFNALISLRASGYKNTSYAVAELIDNAFDAEAKNVKVIFIESTGNDNRKYIDEIITCDDGDGMNDKTLQTCLQFGNTKNIDLDTIVRKNIKGKFGFGLPNASISQCQKIQVYSKMASTDYRKTYLDLEELKKNNSITIPEIRSVDLPIHYNEVGAILNNNKGTIVSWRDFDRLSKSRAKTLIDNSQQIFGRLYRYLLSAHHTVVLESWVHNRGNNAYIKETFLKVKPNDPLFLIENCFIGEKLKTDILRQETEYAKYYKKYLSTSGIAFPTNEMLLDYCPTYDFRWRGKSYLFEIKTSIAQLDIQKPGISKPGNITNTGKFYGDKMNDGNISFVRADREIASGHFGFYKPTAPELRWATVEIKFTADSDDLMGVHNNKQSIEFIKYEDKPDSTERWEEHTATYQQAREKLWFELSNIISSCWKAAIKETSKRAIQWEVDHIVNPTDEPSLPQGTNTTLQTIKDVDGTKPIGFTQTDKDELLNRLKEKYPNVEEQHIINSIEKYDQSQVRGCVLYNHFESKDLWSYTNVGNFLIVLINTNHAFYQNIIEPFKMANFEAPLSALELFITSLAWEEYHHFSMDEKYSDTMELFRSYVGLHLQRYIKENDIKIDEEELVNLNGEIVQE